jgi:hypothetical protein
MRPGGVRIARGDRHDGEHRREQQQWSKLVQPLREARGPGRAAPGEGTG